MNTKKLIKEMKKIHAQQPSVVAAILLAIRARMEKKADIENRIGKTFPNGNRGVLFVGKAGVGKTRFMTKVYEGLGLSGVNKQGVKVGKWLPSTGGSTGIGMYEVLEVNNDAIIFADELSLDTQSHLSVMKQIANGELIRPKHGSIDSIPFSGLLIGATNGVKLPANTRQIEHLLATLDRFMVVQTRAALNTPQQTMQIILSNKEEPKPDWAMIAKALNRETFADLNDAEEKLIREIWAEKTREILDPTRAQWRNSHAVIDIFLFCKRFFGVEDLTKDADAVAFVKEMICDCVLFNPVGLLWLTPLEQVIYDCIKSADVVRTTQILAAVSNAGLSTSRMTISRVVLKMQENNLVVRRSQGKYSTKQPQRAYSRDGSETGTEGLLEDKKPQAITELMNNL